jgi:hypothetical protein
MAENFGREKVLPLYPFVRVVEKEYPFVRVREGKGGDALASDVALGFPDPIISGIAAERHVLDQTHCPILVQRS